MATGTLWILAPVMLVSALLVGLFIRNVVRLVRRARILSVPLVERQDIEFLEAGRVVLCVEGPRFTTRFARLVYELSTNYGTPVTGRRTWFGAITSGVSTARMEVRVYEIPHPGRYVLRIQNLEGAREGDAKHRLVFTKPHLFQAIGYVIGIVLAGGLFIVSLVFFASGLAGTGPDA